MNNMTLKDAIDILTKWVQVDRNMRDNVESDYDKFCEEKNVAIDTVLRAIKIKDEYLKMISFVLTNPYECMSMEDIEGDIEDAKAYCVMGLNNDDESVIGLNGKKNFNILHEEVQDE